MLVAVAYKPLTCVLFQRGCRAAAGSAVADGVDEATWRQLKVGKSLFIRSSVNSSVHLSVCFVCLLAFLHLRPLIYRPAASTAGGNSPAFPFTVPLLLNYCRDFPCPRGDPRVVTSVSRSPRRTRVCTRSFSRTTEERTRLR